MCEPLLIAGLALSVGSMAANSSAAAQQQQARDDALAAERERQKKFDQKAQALNTDSRERYHDFRGQQKGASKELKGVFKDAANTDTVAPDMLPKGNADIVTKAVAQQQKGAKQDTNARASDLGDLRSFGDLLGDIGLLQARDAGAVGQIGNFKRGSAEVLPYELEAAAQEGGGMRFLGDMLSGLGGLASSGLGMGPAAAAATVPGSVPLPLARPTVAGTPQRLPTQKPEQIPGLFTLY